MCLSFLALGKKCFIFSKTLPLFFFSSHVQFSCSLLKLLIILIKSIALLDSGLTVLIMVVLIILVNAIVPSQNQANFTMQICTEYSLRTTLYCSSIKGVLKPLNIRKYKRYTNVCCHLLFSCREKT